VTDPVSDDGIPQQRPGRWVTRGVLASRTGRISDRPGTGGALHDAGMGPDSGFVGVATGPQVARGHQPECRRLTHHTLVCQASCLVVHQPCLWLDLIGDVPGSVVCEVVHCCWLVVGDGLVPQLKV